jgi:hypothetical protein
VAADHARILPVNYQPEKWSFGVDAGIPENMGPNDRFGASFSLTEANLYRSAVDELTIGEWFHLERLDVESYSLRIGDELYTIARIGAKAYLRDDESGDLVQGGRLDDLR